MTRNHFEHEYLRYVARLDANVVPKVLYHSDEKALLWSIFPMIFTWKANPLKETLKLVLKEWGNPGKIHRESWGDKSLLHKFDTTELFIQLRVDPYLYTTERELLNFASFLNKREKD